MITIELPVLLVFFTFMFTSSIYTNLVIYRTCYIVLGYNKSECALLGNTYNNITAHLEKLVEPEANVINMVRSVVESVFTVTICIFIGPWSDRFGRKPVILAGQIGFAMSSALVTLYCFFDLSPWFLALCSVPSMVTGGFATFLTVVIAYIADTSTENTRGVRMAIFEALLTVGSLLGTVLSSYVFYATSYQALFAIATGCNVVSALHTWYFVPESRVDIETENRIKEFFTLTNVKEMLRVAAKKRDDYKRGLICICTAILTVYIFIINGGGMSFQFLREKFGWTLTHFTLFSSTESIVWAVGSLIATYTLHKWLRVTESVLILLGAISMMNCSLLMAMATSNAIIYSTPFVGVLGGLISPMVRSMVSKLVAPEEVGKIFALISSSEFLFGLGAAPLYTVVYNATLDIDAGLFYYLSVGLYGIILILTGIMITLQFKTPSLQLYNQLQEETTESSAINGY